MKASVCDSFYSMTCSLKTKTFTESEYTLKNLANLSFHIMIWISFALSSLLSKINKYFHEQTKAFSLYFIIQLPDANKTSVWSAALYQPQPLGTKRTRHETQACALTGNLTSDPFVCSPVLNLLSHTSKGYTCLYYNSLIL